MVSTYFRPDVASTGVIMTDLAEQLARFGHEVHVVTTMPHYGTSAGNGATPVRRENWRGVEVVRLRIYTPSDRASFRQRLLNYVSFNAQAAVQSLVARDCDVALIPSPPLTNGLVGDILRRVRGVPFVYNVQDIWPDVLFRAGLNRESAIAGTLRRMEGYIYSRAAALAVISQGFRRNLEQKGVDPARIAVISNFFDTESVKPGPRRNRFSAAHGLDDRFVVLFAGNVGHSQGLETVLSAARELRRLPKVLFLIVGDGASKADLVSKAAAMELDNVRFLPFQPHKSLPDLYATADLCLVPLKAGFTGESVPCKVFTIMASGRAMVASVDENSDTWELVRDAGCGTTVPPESPAALAREIERLVATPDELRARGAAGRLCVTEHFTSVAIARQYEELLRRVARPRAAAGSGFERIALTPAEERGG